jgi:hypothetical protein
MMARGEDVTDSAKVVADAKVAAGSSDTPDTYDTSVTTKAPAERIEPGSAAAAPSRWIRPIGDYERRETTIVEGLRYG